MMVELVSVHYTENVNIHYNCEIASKIFLTVFPIKSISDYKLIPSSEKSQHTIKFSQKLFSCSEKVLLSIK